MTMAFHTLRWIDDGALEILDQRRLPTVVAYLRATSAEQVADAIRVLAVRGAPAIGCAAAYGVAVEAHRLSALPAADVRSALPAAFRVLETSRPTAVNLFWALNRMGAVLARTTDATGAGIAASLLREAHGIHAEDIAANHRMGALGAALLPHGATVLTHCNAGALATAGHGTALGIIRSAIAAGNPVTVFADETRPVLQGARLTAWELQQDGIPVTLLPDVAAATLLARGAVDAVIVGADRVAANGDVANKVGTYPLAVLADRHGVPFYVACPRSTLDFSIATGAGIPIEARAADEVTGFGGVTWAPEGVAVFNPAFDVTPAALVSALVTEMAVIHRPDRIKLAVLNTAERSPSA